MANEYTHALITAWDEDNRVIKHKPHVSLVNANAHLDKIKDKYSDAFVAEIESFDSNQPRNWLVNPVDKTLSHVPYEESSEEILKRLKNAALKAEKIKVEEEMLSSGTTEEALLYQTEKAGAG